MTDDIDAFLAHHGVKGQKWGIRNEPKKHSRDFKLASNLMQAKYGSKVSGTSAVKDLQKSKTQANAEHEKKIKTGKKIALGLLVGGVAIAGTAVAYKYVKDNPQIGDKVKNLLHRPSSSEAPISKEEIAKWTKSSIEPISGMQKLQNTQGAVLNRFSNMDTYLGAIQDDGKAEEVIKSSPAMTVDAGKSIFRLSSGKIDDPFLGKDYAYVNIGEEDHRRYQAIYKFTMGAAKSGGNVFSHIFTTKKAIKIPSGNELIEAAKAVHKKTSLDPLRNSQMLPNLGSDSKGDFYKNLFADVQGIIFSNDKDARPGTKELVHELTKRGFDGAPDLADNGRITKSAVLLFDPAEKLAVKESKKLTDSLILEALSKIKSANPFED